MKTKLRPIVLVIAFLATGFGCYQLGLHRRMNAADAAPQADASKKPLYWHDPMYPNQKFDKPGKSPFMDMQLVPVYGNDSSNDDGGSHVSISPRIQQNLGIRTAEVVKANLGTTLEAVGNVVYNEPDEELVQARSNGFIERLYVRAAFDPVKKGQALAELYVPEWVAAQEEYLSAKRIQGGSTNDLAGLVDGARQRMRLAGMTDAQIHLVESSNKVHSRITITSPTNGVIAELAVHEGMTVMTGAPMFRINGLSTVWVNAEVPETATAQLKPGVAVTARSPALPASVFQGKISALLPEIDPITRTQKARIELTNPHNELLPGMFATIGFASAMPREVLQVPSEAVIQTGKRSVVMVAQGDGKFQPVDVEVGAESNGKIEIRKGLQAGQHVVISGQFLVDSEASLTGTADRMADNSMSSDKIMNAIHHGEGKVEHIGKEAITISHGQITSLNWGAMTMDFKLPQDGLPRNVAEGDMVAFDIRQQKDGTFAIVAISPTANVSMQGDKETGKTGVTK